MKNLLVMDKEAYQDKQSELLDIMNQKLGNDNSIIYTTYEDALIRKVRNFKYVGSFLQHILYWKKSYSYAKKIISLNADNIYCINPIVGLFLGFFNKNARIILTGFLFEPKDNRFYYLLRKWFTKKCLRGIDKAIVYGSSEVKYYENIFQLNKFVFLPYGIDFDTPNKYIGKLPQEFFFSGGGSNRDYGTLINAYNQCDNSVSSLVIATQSWRVGGYNTDRIKVIDDVVVENFGDVLKKARLVILSLKDSEISAGHMVMFQAMALGVPIVVNDIPAIRDYVDETQVDFYQSGNINELCMKLESFEGNSDFYLSRAKNAQKKYNRELTFNSLLFRLLDI